jgi:hypothetical protein
MSLTALTVKLIFLSSLEVPFVLVTVQGPNLHLVEENQAKFFLPCV